MATNPAALTLIDALRLLATTTMREFTASDWLAYKGANSKRPLIGETSEKFIVILDDDVLYITDEEGREYNLWHLRRV